MGLNIIKYLLEHKMGGRGGRVKGIGVGAGRSLPSLLLSPYFVFQQIYV